MSNGLLTRTEAVAIGNDSGGNRSTASLVGAVADTVAKVDVLAKARVVVGSAVEGWGQGEHVVNTGLLEESQPLRATSRRDSRSAHAIGHQDNLRRQLGRSEDHEKTC
jgi:hypothetical protein